MPPRKNKKQKKMTNQKQKQKQKQKQNQPVNVNIKIDQSKVKNIKRTITKQPNSYIPQSITSYPLFTMHLHLYHFIIIK